MLVLLLLLSCSEESDVSDTSSPDTCKPWHCPQEVFTQTYADIHCGLFLECKESYIDHLTNGSMTQDNATTAWENTYQERCLEDEPTIPPWAPLIHEDCDYSDEWAHICITGLSASTCDDKESWGFEIPRICSNVCPNP